jgi:uncharacterized protein
MATSFYDLSVPTFLQTVRAVAGFLDRAARHCAETGADPDDFVQARLFDDMAPFHFQIEAAWHHSVWGLEAVKTGVFAPPALVGPVPFADLQAMMGKAEMALEAFTPDEVKGWAGKDLDLQIGPRRLAFTAETLILSFSLPNFHFHAVTPTTSCDRGACLSASATTRAGCVPSRLVPRIDKARHTASADREADPRHFSRFGRDSRSTDSGY